MQFSDLNLGHRFTFENTAGQPQLRLDRDYIKVSSTEANALTPRNGGACSRDGNAVTVRPNTPVCLVR